MYSVNLHFDVEIYKSREEFEACLVPSVDGSIYAGARGSSPMNALNRLLSSLKKSHPDINIHLHLVSET